MYSHYYSNGKLLLSGEYLVLKGAKALALPVRYGQSMTLRSSVLKNYEWSSYQKGKLWFRLIFDQNFKLISSNDRIKARKLLQIIKAAKKINSDFLSKNYNYQIKTNLDFDKNWGLGSSSSLISNIAYWAGIDPFNLFYRVESGSGFDIACARSIKPIIFEIKNGKYSFEQINFNPSFKDKLYFVYLEQKQDTSKEVKKFKRKKEPSKDFVKEVSRLTGLMAKTSSLNNFMKHMARHEDIIASIIGKEPVKNKYFNDFEGEIKSLGAWGGDFVLAASRKSKKDVINYFKEKKYHTIIPYVDMAIDTRNYKSNIIFK